MSKTYVSAAKCTVCGKHQKATYDERQTGYRDPDACLKCGGPTKHKLVGKGSENDPAVSKAEFVNIAYAENERWSESMGVPSNQVEQFRKHYPNSTYSDDGKLLIRNRPDKLRQMKERGFTELGDRR